MPIFLPMLLMLDSEDDRSFLEGLYCEYARLMYAQAYLVLHSRPASEDAVSESLLSLMKKIPLLRSLPCNKLRAYVVSTVKHTALSAVRSANRTRDHAADTPMEEIPEKESLENRVVARAQVEEVRGAIRSLPERERVVLEMKFFRELTDTEIAEELSIREVTVRSTISRARGHLATLLCDAKQEGGMRE